MLGVGDLAVAIHGDQIGWAQVTEGAGVFAARRDLGHSDIFEYGFERVEEVEIFAARGVFVRADEHFFGAATAGNQADASFDEAEVRFRCGVNARGVQRDFASAAESHALRCSDDGTRCVFNGHVDTLKLAHGHVDIVPLAFLRTDQDEHQVRAYGKVRGLIADYHRVEV